MGKYKNIKKKIKSNIGEKKYSTKCYNDFELQQTEPFECD